MRITSLARNMMMMGCLVPLQLNPMSNFCFSLELCISGGFTHPGYQMDDMICFTRWVCKTNRDLKLVPVYSPTLSGPTSGTSYINELAEWARQIRRWTIGSAEVFHYTLIKLKRISPKLRCKRIIWSLIFTSYHCFFIIASNMYLVSQIIAFNLPFELISKEIFYISLVPLMV